MPISYWLSIIRKGLEEGLSGNQILKKAREQGLKIRTKTFYELYNEMKKSYGIISEIFDDLEPHRSLPDYLFFKTPEKLPTKYAFIFEVKHEHGKYTFGIYTDKKYTKAELEEWAKNLAQLEYELKNITRIRLIGAKKRK